MITNPKDFFQQIQNLCEEVALKIKAISSSLSAYLTKSDAEATYLDKTEAANTYLGKTEAANTYLGKTEAANTYLGKTETATRATVADSATSADKATNDANGNNISNTYLKSATASSTYLKQTDAQSKYLGKTAKAESAKTADTATSATSAGNATKAIQDGDGNVISGTYLKSATAQSTYLSKTDASSTYLSKTDASSTYLGKTAKAESAKTADSATTAVSATKATQDGSGNVIEQTYAKKNEIPEVDTSTLVQTSGNRGTLAGYNSPGFSSSAVTIDGASNDDTIVLAAVSVTVSNGSSHQTWTKTIALQNASATVSLGSKWTWIGSKVPTISSNCILVVKWCGTFGIAHLVAGV